MDKFTEEQYQQLGLQLVHLLGLKVKKSGSVDTTWGIKSMVGLGRTVERLITDLPKTTNS